MSRYSTYEHLKVEVAEGIATVTLNRPEVRNAMNKTTIVELRRIWLDLADDKAVYAVVMTGAGSHFSVGGDIKAMAVRPGGDVRDEGEAWDPSVGRRLINNFLELEKPVICAINGDAAGLAAVLAMFCDITVISSAARLVDPHVRLGLVAGDGGVVMWPLILGMNRAKEFLLRGSLISGPDAERMGMVNYCVPADQVVAKAREIALELAQGPTSSIRWTKQLFNMIIKDRVNLLQPAAYALEHLSMETQDHIEAARAFKEKRKPVFHGR